MTKEELERIKQACNFGLKVQIWFNGHWEDFDVRDYSMYSDPFSENRQYRIVGSDYADIAEKRIFELEKENAELKEKLEHRNCVDCSNHGSNMKLLKAKDLLLKFMDLKNKPCAVGHSVNMLLYENICAEAEQFLKKVSK